MLTLDVKEKVYGTGRLWYNLNKGIKDFDVHAFTEYKGQNYLIILK